MTLYDKFISERIEIGSGMIAKVYSWNGYAYKCFNEGYPKEWINYEYSQHEEVCKSPLPVPRYYESEFPNSIKMDLVNGVLASKRMMTYGINTIMNELMYWFEKIHEVKGLKLRSLSEYLLEKIDSAPVSDKERLLAKQCLQAVENEITEPEALCHMDYHPLNVMYEGSDVRIIDWVTAKNGKPIWDYARTYVIFYEGSPLLKRKYLKQILALKKYTKDAFMKAVYVIAVHRLTERNTKKVNKLIKSYSNKNFIYQGN